MADLRHPAVAVFVVVAAAAAVATSWPGGAVGRAAGRPQQDGSLAVVSRTGGVTQAVVLQSNTVYAGVGSSLVILDLASAPTVRTVGAVELPGVVRGVAVSGSYAYVAADYAGLQVVDIGDPANPRAVGSLVEPAGTTVTQGVFYDGGRVYLAEQTDVGGRLVAVNVADPRAPTALGEYEPLTGSLEGAHVVGGRAYLADGQALVIVDFSDPANPVDLGELLMTGESTGVFVAGSRAYVIDAVDSGTSLDYTYFVRVVDVTDPAAPTVLGNYEAPGIIRGVYATGAAAFVYESDDLIVLDVSNPARPVARATRPEPGGPLSLDVEGQRLVVGLASGGFQVLDGADVAQLREVAAYTVPGSPHDLALAGSLLVQIEQVSNPGLRAVDVTDAGRPAARGYFGTSGEADRVVLAGNNAYVADGYEGLRVLDVSDPRSIVELAAYTAVDDVLGVAVVGDRAYLAAGAMGLRILDVSRPAAPRDLGSLDLPGEAWGVVVGGDMAYVAESTVISIVDVSNPARPRGVGEFQTDPYFGNLALVGDRLYVPAGLGLQVLDVTDPAAVVEVDRVPLADGAYDVAVGAGMAFVTSAAGVHAIDLATFTEVGSFVTADFAEGLAVAGDLVYAAGYDAGLYILRWQPGALPTTPAASPTGTLRPGTPTATRPAVSATPTATRASASPTPIVTVGPLTPRLYLPRADRSIR